MSRMSRNPNKRGTAATTRTAIRSNLVPILAANKSGLGGSGAEAHDGFEQDPEAPTEPLHGRPLVVAVVHAREAEITPGVESHRSKPIALGAEPCVRLGVGEAGDHEGHWDSPW